MKSDDIGERWTDSYLATKFIDWANGDVRFCPQWGSWLTWDCKRWKKDEEQAVVFLARDFVRDLLRKAVEIEDEKDRREALRETLFCESDRRIKAILRLAESEPGISVIPDDLDSNPFLLNVENGTLNLQNGNLRSHQREDLLTKLIPIPFHSDAKCPTFEVFLDRIFCGNEALIAFLRRAFGYGLTGDTSEECFFVFWGGGNNGKTTLIETISDAAGGYAAGTPAETLMARYGNTIPNDLARLKGIRFTFASETKEGRYLDESKIKMMTGRDTVVCRFLHREFFEYEPQFKVFFTTNHKPVIRENTLALWRRIRLIPFLETIPPEEQNKHLREKLRAELPGILAWTIRGCLEWQRVGLGEPSEVTQATSEYRAEMDVLAEFTESRCTTGQDVSDTVKSLYAAYSAWCEENREKPIERRSFGRSLGERGFTPVKIKTERGWRGIKVLGHEGHEDPPFSINVFARTREEVIKNEVFDVPHVPPQPKGLSAEEIAQTFNGSIVPRDGRLLSKEEQARVWTGKTTLRQPGEEG